MIVVIGRITVSEVTVNHNSSWLLWWVELQCQRSLWIRILHDCCDWLN